MAILRERTRDHDRFRLVFLENCDHGFRRSALGLRSVALAVGYGVLAVSVLILLNGGDDVDARLAWWSLPVATSVASIFFWSLVVTLTGCVDLWRSTLTGFTKR